MKILWLGLLGLFLLSCGQQVAVKTETGVQKSKQNAQPLPCAIGPASDPQTIPELITYLNSLPFPADLPCILKGLKRPLYVNATSFTLSVQPASNPKSPRLFIFKGKLIIAIVPEGEGSRILEMSEMVGETRSIKGELTLPIYDKIMPAAPYARIVTSGMTSCSGCHKGEVLSHQVDGASVFVSDLFKPSSAKNIALSSLMAEASLCQVRKDISRRCEVLEALFDGEVSAASFPESAPTFLSSFGN